MQSYFEVLRVRLQYMIFVCVAALGFELTLGRQELLLLEPLSALNFERMAFSL
jgi:hypothetical protein